MSTVDGGKATSIVTPLTARNNGDGSKTDVGTVGENGQFFLTSQLQGRYR